ncbi:discoidin domain-containing protein [Faecalicatena contorta]|uniref:discoidin domain-containing protein n=1 Tax=Faecalicatena contorta TaxID=39482 RepID=UPI00189AA68B|nr:discoidin domain-containing protein [Faecalicatena contorta]
MNAEEHWAVVDLEEEKNIGYWVLKNSTEAGCATSDFKLQYSNDKSGSWTDFAIVEGNTEHIAAESLETPVTARYVRLSITKATQTDNSFARVLELELYENKIESAKPFYEKQDILNAEIQTKQEIADLNTEMTTWVASDKNVMVTELEAKGNKAAGIEVETWAADNASNIRPITAVNDDTSVTVTRSSENRHTDDADSWTSKAALSTTIIGADITETDSDMISGKGTLSFTLQPNEKVYIVTAVGGGGRTYTSEGTLWEGETEPDAEAQELLGEVSSENAVRELNTGRQNWWKDYWSASYVDLGTDDEKLTQIQKYYYGAQYILGSTAREDKTAPGLYGVWRVNDTPYWHGDYHMNYNFMSAFYGVNSSNRASLSLPAAEALFNFVSSGEKRAASTAELREINSSIVDKNIEEGDIDPVNGIADAVLFPLGIGPWGSVTDDTYLNECLGAGYNSYIFTQYYDYTLDENILEQAYDYLKKCANFYEAWLATVYKGNIIKNLIMDCQSYTKYRPNETTGGIFVSWRRKEELPTGA